MTTCVIRLPQLQEDHIETHDTGFLDALCSREVTLHSQHWLNDHETIVFMTTVEPTGQFIAVKMDANVEPTDLCLGEFEDKFPSGIWNNIIGGI